MHTTLDPTEVDVPATQALMLDGSSTWEPDSIQTAMTQAFATLGNAIAELGAPVAGPPRAVYHTYSETGTTWTLAFPLSGPPARAPSGDVKVGELAGGPALRFTHVGPYEGLSGTYGEITRWMIEQGHMESEADWSRLPSMWEEYVDDPGSTPPDELRTFIYAGLAPSRPGGDAGSA